MTARIAKRFSQSFLPLASGGTVISGIPVVVQSRMTIEETNENEIPMDKANRLGL
jgi:hypothetical protein